MRPSEVRQWQRVIREFATMAVGVFMLVYETVAAETPNEWLIGAGLTAIGLVPLFRIDERAARRNGNGTQDDEEKRNV